MAKELKKGSFVKRVSAYIIDYLIIFFIVSLVTTPFVDSKKVEKISNETIELQTKYQNNEVSSTELLQDYNDLYYKLATNTGIVTFVTIILNILYFVVFQLYNKGQTIGKKLMNIKVISMDGELNMNQMIFRVLISTTLLCDIINFALMIFSSKNIYSPIAIILSTIQYIVTFISIIMLTSKEGRTIHDMLAHTRVVSIK